MALTKTIVDDKIEVVGDNKAIQVRTATVVKEDGVELSRSFHRRVIHPGKTDPSDNYTKTDLSSESAEIQGIANAAWTDAVHDAWKAHCIKSNKDPFLG